MFATCMAEPAGIVMPVLIGIDSGKLAAKLGSEIPAMTTGSVEATSDLLRYLAGLSNASSEWAATKGTPRAFATEPPRGLPDSWVVPEQ